LDINRGLRWKRSPAGLDELQAFVRHKDGLETATANVWTVTDKLYLKAGFVA
jgi:hypothetical protein